MADELVPAVDVERQTIRGRVCPVCGGKIIPSDRAVYENKTDPGGVFPAWECERCGHGELSEKKAPAPTADPPKKKVEEWGRKATTVPAKRFSKPWGAAIFPPSSNTSRRT